MTDWDARWRSGDTPWDRGTPAPPLSELLHSEIGNRLKGKRILVPGCGSGHDVKALAEAGCHVVGLDLSPAAIDHARRINRTDGADFVCGSFFSFTDGPFDAIWEHTCFCAIDPSERPQYAAACSRLIRSGGSMTGVFYLQPWLPGEIPAPPPHASSKEDIVELLSADFELIWNKVPKDTYPGREGREWLAVFARVT